jgi:intracellular sulfur oxidation DsrE/DsrF family protein
MHEDNKGKCRRLLPISRRRFVQGLAVGGAVAALKPTKGSLIMSTLEKPLHIDIPVKLAEVKVAFSVPALAFEGDLPASIFHIQLIENDIADWRAKAQVIAVFHTNAGHVTLNDKAYNIERNVATGNPYKDLVSDLMKRGVHFELCGATAKIHNWGNEDVLPGIKINTDAMARMTQLVQEGFVKISE